MSKSQSYNFHVKDFRASLFLFNLLILIVYIIISVLDKSKDISLTNLLRSRPQYIGANFVLQTTFPNRELTNESETIEQAKLLNAVVVQRMK